MATYRDLPHTSLKAVTRVTLPKNSQHQEPDVKVRIRKVLAPHFMLREEVRGIGPMGDKVRIDFWCFPKPMTIDKGWPPRYFGIEAKAHGDADQRKKTATRLVYQASMYRMSSFPTEGAATANPDFVLIHPPLATILQDSEDDPQYRDGFMFALAKEAAMFRVGELVITGNEFEVYFHGINRWYSSRWGKNRADCLGKEDTHASR